MGGVIAGFGDGLCDYVMVFVWLCDSLFDGVKSAV